eukprot:CAMPEP_0172603114 /NCGR_PEP_ID=MMETSP1068-20121228/23318_1 /TAXON_ID=35684 /ORGANISM="Pseudopedinella elastica, Strain CCMP716" /LENGTH=597 /DNA_ID=CAMNT_0013404729 /DNA_START=310 /DNA_END=2103 /DNA_ORIENTATION=+
MDTPEFQRLRELKQLGGSVFVFKDASHTRFEHSLGVAHLSRKMVEHFQRLQEKRARRRSGPGLLDDPASVSGIFSAFDSPEAQIDSRDVTCVSLGGLVHDLGHGPFSHMFEDFVNSVRVEQGLPKFCHEDMSARILKHLLTKHGIEMDKYMETTPEEAEQDLAFVLKLIEGLSPNDPMPVQCGRHPSKRFLFEIVANKRNGIDVDKLDYFQRDSSTAIGKTDVQVDRIIEASAVCTLAETEAQGQGHTAVCYEQKLGPALFALFAERMDLHDRLYQHHVVNVVERMITDAFRAAMDVPIVRGSPIPSLAPWEETQASTQASTQALTQGDYTLYGATSDLEAYVNLGDWVFKFIQGSFDPRLAEAQEIIKRIESRNLYAQCGNPLMRRPKNASKAEIKEKILQEWARLGQGNSQGASQDQETSQGQETSQANDNVIVIERTLNYGKDPVDGTAGFPLRRVIFFNPKDLARGAFYVREEQISELRLPRAWEKVEVWVYVKDPSTIKVVSDAWENVKRELKSRDRNTVTEENMTQNSPARPGLTSPLASTRRVSCASANSYLGSSSAASSSGRRRSRPPLFSQGMDPIEEADSQGAESRD